MHRCECVVRSLSYKCQCILICTYTVNEVNLNLFLVWPRSLEWTVDGCKNGASKWTNYKKLQKSFICRFGWKDFPSYYKYIHSRAIFVLEKGGVLLLGTVLLLGHIRYIYIYMGMNVNGVCCCGIISITNQCQYQVYHPGRRVCGWYTSVDISYVRYENRNYFWVFTTICSIVDRVDGS